MLKKIGAILAVCLMLVTVAACGSGGGSDLSEINSKLNELQDRVEDLEGQLNELEKQITVFYDWDNPIIATSDELFSARGIGYDNYIEKYGNKVVQVTGRVNGSGGTNVTIYSIGSTYPIYCRFAYVPSVSNGQTVTIKGIAGVGFDDDNSTGLSGLYYSRII